MRCAAVNEVMDKARGEYGEGAAADRTSAEGPPCGAELLDLGPSRKMRKPCTT